MRIEADDIFGRRIAQHMRIVYAWRSPCAERAREAREHRQCRTAASAHLREFISAALDEFIAFGPSADPPSSRVGQARHAPSRLEWYAHGFQNGVVITGVDVKPMQRVDVDLDILAKPQEIEGRRFENSCWTVA